MTTQNRLGNDVPGNLGPVGNPPVYLNMLCGASTQISSILNFNCKYIEVCASVFPGLITLFSINTTPIESQTGMRLIPGKTYIFPIPPGNVTYRTYGLGAGVNNVIIRALK